MRVLLFGPLADLAGWRDRTMESAVDIAELKALLRGEDPALGAALDGPGVQVAIDQVVVRGETGLDGVDEVAFLPPMSGG